MTFRSAGLGFTLALGENRWDRVGGRHVGADAVRRGRRRGRGAFYRDGSPASLSIGLVMSVGSLAAAALYFGRLRRSAEE
jgi:hypothetical protein